jgi:hypothetical protein
VRLSGGSCCGFTGAVGAASVGNWYIFNDTESQCCYYWHKEEGYTTWDAPEDIRQLWDAASASASSGASLLHKPTLGAGLERSSKLPPIRLGKLPLAHKHTDVGAGLGKLLDGDGGEKSKKKKKRSKEGGKRAGRVSKEAAKLSPVAVHAHSHPGDAPVIVTPPSAGAQLESCAGVSPIGAKSPRPDVVEVVTPPNPAGADGDGGSDSDNECSPDSPDPSPHSLLPCPPLQPPPAHVPSVILFSGPKVKPSSPPSGAKSALLSSMPGRSIGAHATSPTHSGAALVKSYNFTNNVLSNVTAGPVSPTRVPVGSHDLLRAQFAVMCDCMCVLWGFAVVPAGARVVAAPRPAHVSTGSSAGVRRKSAFGAPVPTGPIMPGPPPRVASSTLGGDASTPSPSEGVPLSSQFVRQHLMQASAMQSIAAANDTLYPAMPDVRDWRGL